MQTEKKSFLNVLFSYAGGEKKKMILSVILSVISVMLGLVPFYCMYELISMFVTDTVTTGEIVKWCMIALLSYALKILTFTLSTGTSHSMAYTILEGLRLRLADRFLHAPLGNVENHTIGEIKNMMVDKIENLEPPLAHMIPEGAGHIVLPVVSIIALFIIDWRLALASLVTFPLSLVCMALTFKISGKNFAKYDESANYMNSTIVEYIEGIEVIKAFGRAGVCNKVAFFNICHHETQLCIVPFNPYRHSSGCSGIDKRRYDHRCSGGTCCNAVYLNGRFTCKT